MIGIRIRIRMRRTLDKTGEARQNALCNTSQDSSVSILPGRASKTLQCPDDGNKQASKANGAEGSCHGAHERPTHCTGAESVVLRGDPPGTNDATNRALDTVFQNLLSEEHGKEQEEKVSIGHSSATI